MSHMLLMKQTMDCMVWEGVLMGTDNRANVYTRSIVYVQKANHRVGDFPSQQGILYPYMYDLDHTVQ